MDRDQVQTNVVKLDLRVTTLEQRLHLGFVEVENDIDDLRKDLMWIRDKLEGQRWDTVERTAAQVELLLARLNDLPASTQPMTPPPKETLKATAAGGGLVAAVVALAEAVKFLITGG